jgi:predicted small lipoprotein YifL
MKKTLLALLLMVAVSTSLVGCGTAKPTEGDKPAETEKTETAPAKTADNGYLPVDYPVVKTTAVTGDYVLAPSRTSVDEAFTKGLDQTTMTFYAAKMVTPGEAASAVEDLTSAKFTVPNSVIVPMTKGATAEKGDTLLTWWQSGSGLMKAYVVEGGATPKVQYLDDFVTDQETLLADSFSKVTGDLAPGVSVAVKDADYGTYDNAVVINVSGDKVLVLGFADSLEMVDKANLTVIPLDPGVAVGDTVLAPIISSYDPVVVKEVKADIGQIVGEYTWVDEVKNETFVYGELIKELK